MRSRRRAFTMLEMVIVIGMMAVVVFVMLVFNTGLVGRIRDISLEVKKGREGPAIMRLIEDDLIGAYADARMTKIFEGQGSRSGTEVRFVTSRDSVLFLNGFQSDLTETGYKIERNRDRGSRDLYTLWRREDFSMDDEPLEGGLWIPVADNVVSFEMRFYDLPEEGLPEEEGTTLANLVLGQGDVEELDSWDGNEKRYLPYAVKIMLTLDIREGEDRENAEMEADGIQRFVGFVRLPPFSRTLPEAEDRVNLALNALPAPPGRNTNNTNNTPGQ